MPAAAYINMSIEVRRILIISQPKDPAHIKPLIEIKPKWSRASEMGMITRDFGYTIAALTDGAFVDEFYLDDDKIDIYLYSESGKNASLDSLNQISVYTPIGAIVPRSSITHIEETVDTNIIRRVNSQRAVTLSIIPRKRSRWKPVLKSSNAKQSSTCAMRVQYRAASV